MQTLTIRGGSPLAGEITISGSKNAVLPMLAAAVLFRQECIIRDCPGLTDVDSALEILEFLGAKVRRIRKTIRIDPGSMMPREIPPELMGKMRGSLLFAGAMLGRFGTCWISRPGGCALGERPVDFHLQGLRALGAEEGSEDAGFFSGGLRGGSFCLPYPSVGATENLILAALGGREKTILQNSAREPEIVCLCDFLRMGGCRICGDGTGRIEICPGFPDRAEMEPIPDRMEAATFACAAASAGGWVRMDRARAEDLLPVLEALKRSGCQIEADPGGITVRAESLRGAGSIKTEPYPGFPTDAQAPFLAAMLRAEGITEMKETVFSDRMQYIEDLHAMGARIICRESRAIVLGGRPLSGTQVKARDLRGGAALAVAALAARGETEISGLQHLMRGYEGFSRKLGALGAKTALT